MRSIFAVAALCFALGSCAALQKLSTTQVPVNSILLAATSVDVAETAAKNYIIFCTPNPSPAGCNDSLIKTKIAPDVKAIVVARTAAEKFITDNPNATLGPATLVSAVTDAVGVLQTVLAQNNVTTK